MRALDAIKSTKFETEAQYLNVYLSLYSSDKNNSLQPTLNLKRNRPSHWSINKLITANDRVWDTC